MLRLYRRASVWEEVVDRSGMLSLGESYSERGNSPSSAKMVTVIIWNISKQKNVFQNWPRWQYTESSLFWISLFGSLDGLTVSKYQDKVLCNRIGKNFSISAVSYCIIFIFSNQQTYQVAWEWVSVVIFWYFSVHHWTIELFGFGDFSSCVILIFALAWF